MKFEDGLKMIMNMYESEELKELYPESYSVISGLVTQTGTDSYRVAGDFFSLACSLHETDGAMDMHPLVAEFCLKVYFDKYAEGNPDAALNLGSLYYTGRAGEQNYAKAVEYYSFAADRGSLIASENLGYCYYYGRDVDKDYEKSFKYFIKGALADRIISLYKIGDFYKNGYFVDRDPAEAFRIYERCAGMMDDENLKLSGADVYMRLGECYYRGTGTEKNLKLALQLYQAAERLYYDRLESGDYMIRNNLDRVIKTEEEIRQLIRNSMPDRQIYEGEA